MTWTKIGDEFLLDPELLSLPRGVRLLHVEGRVWANAQGTDGAVPLHMLHRITDEPDAERSVEALVAIGRWEATETGWRIVDFLKDQPSAEEVQLRRTQAAWRTKRWRQHRDGDHKDCNPKYCNASRDASADASGVGSPPRPPRPPRKGKGRAEEFGPVAIRDGAGPPDRLAQRREMARHIRDAPDGETRRRELRAFERLFGDRYPGSVARPADRLHPAMSTTVRETWADYERAPGIVLANRLATDRATSHAQTAPGTSTITAGLDTRRRVGK